MQRMLRTISILSRDSHIFKSLLWNIFIYNCLLSRHWSRIVLVFKSSSWIWEKTVLIAIILELQLQLFFKKMFLVMWRILYLDNLRFILQPPGKRFTYFDLNCFRCMALYEITCISQLSFISFKGGHWILARSEIFI